MSAKIDFTEFLISLSIIMMMLSFVSERLSNFLKLYFQDKKIFIPYPHFFNGKYKKGLTAHIKILATKQPNIFIEKVREYRVMTINIIIGVIIALVVNANFFEIITQISSISNKVGTDSLSIIPGWKIPDLSNSENLIKKVNFKLLVGGIYLIAVVWSLSLILFNSLIEVENRIQPQSRIRRPFYILVIAIPTLTLVLSLIFNWQNILKGFLNIGYHGIGYIITGLFLSLGSKFWHDLLDVLFKLKNTQQRLNEKSTYTDYDSPETLMNLANTSHYEIAQSLMEKYESKLWEIEGVVSVGLNSKLNKQSGFFKKEIEVEYTSSQAQTELLKLRQEGWVMLNANKFYLKDYLTVLYTEELEILSTIDAAPLCFAHNKKRPANKGSFSLFKDGNGKLIAQSNLHVFALNDELKKFYDSGNGINSKDIILNINGEIFEAKIKDVKFHDSIFNTDYANAEVILNGIGADKIIKLYNDTVKIQNIRTMDNDRMKMFGAVSKELVFKSSKFKTTCRVNYGTFIKEMRLYKIFAYSADNVSKGDSGSLVYYKDLNSDDNTLKQGMLVAKSDHYAYMFLIKD